MSGNRIDDLQKNDTEARVSSDTQTRRADALDVHVLTCALLVAGCGDVEGLSCETVREGVLRYRLSTVAINSILQVDADEALTEEAVILAQEGLEADVVHLLGDVWEDEGVVGLELLAWARLDDLISVALAAASEEGLVVEDKHAGEVAADDMPLALLASIW